MKNRIVLITGLLAGIASFTATQVQAQTCRAAEPSLCLRACWNAKAPCGSPTQMSALNRAVVHHTASSSDYSTSGLTDSKAKVRGVQNYHMDINGWCDIGYHFLADKHGNMFSGRSNSVDDRPQGAHDGCNSQSFGFTALGYYHPPYNNAATSALVNALEKLIAWRMPGGWGPTGSGTTYCNGGTDKIMGHRQVKATACPGDVLYSKIKDGNGFENAVAARRSCP